MPGPVCPAAPWRLSRPFLFRPAAALPPTLFLLLALAFAPAVRSVLKDYEEVSVAGEGMRTCTNQDLETDMYGNAAMDCGKVDQAVRSRTTCMAQPDETSSDLYCCTESAAETLLARPNASVEHVDCSLMELDTHGHLGDKSKWTWYVEAEYHSRLTEEKERILALFGDEASTHVVREKRAPKKLRKPYNKYKLPRANAATLAFTRHERIDEESQKERAEFQDMAACMRGWKVANIKPLGHGAFGDVYEGVANGDINTDTSPVAIKIVQLMPPNHKGRSDGLVHLSSFAREVAAQTIAVDLGLAPKVRDFLACGQEGGDLLVGFLIMDFVDGKTLEEYLRAHQECDDRRSMFCDPNHVATTRIAGHITENMYQSLKTALPKLDDYGLITIDQHTGNIMVRKDDQKLFFIDFGLATGKSHEAGWWKDILEDNYGCEDQPCR